LCSENTRILFLEKVGGGEGAARRRRKKSFYIRDNKNYNIWSIWV